MTLGGVEGFSWPPGIAPELENWFAQIRSLLNQLDVDIQTVEGTAGRIFTFGGKASGSDTTIVVDHALDGAPVSVVITPATQGAATMVGNGSVYVSTITSTQFVIVKEAGDAEFYWIAILDSGGACPETTA